MLDNETQPISEITPQVNLSANKYAHLDGKFVKVVFPIAGKRLANLGTLDAHTFEDEIRIGGWKLHVDSVIAVEEAREQEVRAVPPVKENRVQS